MGALTQRPHTRYPVRVPEEVGAVRRAVARMAAGAGGARAGDAEFAVTELATNLLRHATSGGFILARPAGGGVELLAVDAGPGLRPGDVPPPGPPGVRPPPPPPAPPGAAGLGIGLAGVRRAASAFDWYSGPAGTVILAHIGPREPAAGGCRWGGVNVPFGGAGQSGDGWMVAAGGVLAAMVVDGLGHGPAAAAAAAAALGSFTRRAVADPAEALLRAHDAMRGTRGGVAAAAVLDAGCRELAFAGVGNVAARALAGTASHAMVSREGTLGTHVTAPAPFVQRRPWGPGSALVLASDGLGRHWDLAAYPGLLRRDPAVAAAVLYRDHGSAADDVTVLVIQDAGEQR